ncbi:MAG: HEAT repeat domain-containing protein [Phycisphaerae bacterium]|nr:HEAT repeat domain-containing protein [Phycisphaerae bacterium]
MSERSWLPCGLAGVAIAAVATLGGCAPPPPVNLAQIYADARATLDRGLADAEPFTRSHTIEAMADTVGLHAGQSYEQALADPSPLVRFAAAMAIGDTGYSPAQTHLLKMAQDKELEPDRRVVPSVIYALYRLGDTTYASELYALLFDNEREVRANAALAMGKMQEPSGIGPLKTRMNDEQDPLVRLQIIESLAMLGDSVSALSLEAYTKKTPFMDERLVAIPAMARVRSSTAAHVLTELLESRQPPRVRVAAAGALGMLGQSNPTGYTLCQAAVNDPRKVLDQGYGGRRAGSELEVASLQRLAAISLGWMGNQAAVVDLHRLLDSRDGAIRAAAAMSILRLLPGYLRPLPPSALATGQAPPAPAVSEVPPVPQPPPQTALQPASQPAPEPVPQAVPERVWQLVPKPAWQPAPEPASQPAPEAASQPAPEPESQPAPEPTSQPTSEPTEDVAPAEPQPPAPPAPTPREPSAPLKLRSAGGKD